jgi:UDP-N-acetylmuramoyl-L-alanyl-D-glutamate--2,6-diaminopimelate ligase
MDDPASQVIGRLRERGVIAGSLATDSRALAAGEVFLAYPGGKGDGRRHIPQALARGASAVLWERDGFEWDPAWAVPNLAVEGLRNLAGPLASHLNGEPSARLRVIAVTGTNGKTSCSQWIAQALDARGARCGVVGTLGLGVAGGALQPNPNTTPDPVLLQRSLRDMADAGAVACAMEASSIGLDQGRLNGTLVRTALYTNLSRDHLDYHGDMERYAAAKRRLFDLPGLENAVLNMDDPQGVILARSLAGRGVARWGYALHEGAAARAGLEHWVEAGPVSYRGASMAFEARGSFGSVSLQAPVLGRFNAANLLGVFCVLLAEGHLPRDAADALARLSPVPGRMHCLGGEAQPLVVVDYAHTPDALDKVLESLSDVARARGGRLAVVFGCGGDRDPGKRALMGAIAGRRAGRVMLTSDNPRSEDPDAIISAISVGVGVAHDVQPDRALAIRQVLGSADARDVVLLAGKGHEAWQETAGVRTPFSDAEHARRALEARAG